MHVQQAIDAGMLVRQKLRPNKQLAATIEADRRSFVIVSAESALSFLFRNKGATNKCTISADETNTFSFLAQGASTRGCLCGAGSESCVLLCWCVGPTLSETGLALSETGEGGQSRWLAGTSQNEGEKKRVQNVDLWIYTHTRLQQQLPKISFWNRFGCCMHALT